jgi:hypothetical protein
MKASVLSYILSAAIMAGTTVADATPTEFATREIGAAAKAAAVGEPRVIFKIDRSLGAQAYRFNGSSNEAVVVTGGDASGAMYGGLDIAEALRLGTVKELVSDPRLHTPHVLDRGIKFNVPLDWRTPTYSDRSTAAQNNIPEMWSMDFWHQYIDEMARDRYNLLSLWSEHPFPSMVKVPEFPDVALDDVWQGRTDANGAYTDHVVVKKMTMDQKIAFWREVMQYAHDRGVAVYIFTWNVFTHGATGKYGITDAMSNSTTVAYMRDSVRELINTYPLLDGMGITSGENMPGATDDAKEKWIWATYGEGARDALRAEPRRRFHIIHRFHQTSLSQIMQHWKDFPGPVDFSYKYSVAHMYSIANPPMIKEALDVLPAGKKMWLEVRNDDIYSFRFGDPDYMRDYVDNMPPADVSGGYMMGADGYNLGREFLDRDPGPGPHELVTKKQWYSFMLMGRLSYDPTIPDTHFQQVLEAHFPGISAFGLYRALQSASQTMPLITRFFWGDIDIKWFPESSSKRPADKGYYTVHDFAEGESMPGANVLNIRQWRTNVLEKRPMTETTPLQIADALEDESRATLQSVAALRMQVPRSNAVEFRKTLLDCESLGWLAQYYAEKIRAASDLGLYDLTHDVSQQASAIGHLNNALDAWKHYATLRDGQYVPALYGRAGYVNITAMTAKVAEDLIIARDWKPGSVLMAVPGQGTEAGVKP